MPAEIPANLLVAFVPRGVLALRGRLGFCPAPGRWHLMFLDADSDLQADRARSVDPRRPLEEDLASLRACGTTTLVVLLEEEEMARIGLAELLDQARRAGLEAIWFPIPDGTAPADMESTVRLVERILERLAAGGSVVVHCHGGVGRSGTIVAAALVASGADPTTALAIVRDARPGAATAPGQEEFVHAFARAFGERAGSEAR
jgi:protein-tyrosine phosphatase